MYIIKHVTIRVGSTFKTRLVTFKSHEDAIEYLRELRDFETVLLFKKDQRRMERRKEIKEAV